jgi:cyclophilin family peptidyl-prolyl cis-trans isomerase
LIGGLLALMMMAGTAAAQGGQQPQRRPAPEPQPSTPPIRVEGRVQPPMSALAPPLTAENSWVLYLSDGGRVVVQLRPDQAPNHVERIKTLTRRGFYNGIAFHRVVEGFMAQGGDPTGTGTGQSDLPDLNAEFNVLPHLRGAVAMARTENPNSANSQFYIMFVPRLTMDGKYTVFGRVVSGMEHVDRIHRGEPPASPTRIVRAAIGSDNVPPPTAEEIAAAARPPAAPAQAPLQILEVPTLPGVQVQTAPRQPAPQTTPAPATPPPAGASPSQQL